MSSTDAHQHAPFIDSDNLPAPKEGVIVTQFLTVRSVARSRAFYSEVLGGQWSRRRPPASSSWPTGGYS